MTTKPFLVAGEWRTRDETIDVNYPYDGSLVARVAVPSDDDVEEAVAKAHDAFAQARLLPAHARADALAHVSARLAERVDEVAELIVREGGKPMKWARVEAQRAVSTFRWAAEEARRLDGDVLRLDAEAVGAGRLGIVRRFPLGPVLGITPFNFPVNLVAHKIAPALGAGCPIVVKPATKTPLGSLLLGELVSETELPDGMISVLPLDAERSERLAADARFAKITFTGSSDVGWRLKKIDPRKAFTLELGGNAGAIVHEDADLGHAAARIAFGGYYQAGQSCVAVQRVLAHAPVYDDLVERLVKHVTALQTGDPMDPNTDVGPIIDAKALERVDAWVNEAVAQGAHTLVGGKRNDPFYEPTILTDTTPQMKVRCEEIFGPVITVQPYQTFEEAIAEANATRYGLQAGVFTKDIERAFLAHRELNVGGVIVNDVSAFRADQMPYGGTKDSGTGREGLRYAMREMTEPRIMVLSGLPV
jgi:aldehyde dehydrogenase (NAD+)